MSAPPASRALRGRAALARGRAALARGRAALRRARERVGERVGSRRDGTADGGFTLIEVLVSFGILTVVGTAGVMAVVTGITTTNANRDRVTAANVAQQEIGRAQALPQASLTATPTATSTSVVGTRRYTVTRTVAYSPAGVPCPSVIATGTPHSVLVTVDVSWPGANRSVQMGSVLSCR